jgi:hypothetical protein
LECGVRPWLKPWSASNVGHSILPRRHNGVPYQGINVLLLWGEAMTRSYTATIWMTFRQALELWSSQDSMDTLKRRAEQAGGPYEWLKNPVSNRAKEGARLLRLIRASYKASHGIYDSGFSNAPDPY